MEKSDVYCVMLKNGAPIIGRIFMGLTAPEQILNPCMIVPGQKGLQVQQVIGVPDVMILTEAPVAYYKITDKGIIAAYIQVTSGLQVATGPLRNQ